MGGDPYLFRGWVMGQISDKGLVEGGPYLFGSREELDRDDLLFCCGEQIELRT